MTLKIRRPWISPEVTLPPNNTHLRQLLSALDHSVEHFPLHWNKNLSTSLFYPWSSALFGSTQNKSNLFSHVKIHNEGQSMRDRGRRWSLWRISSPWAVFFFGAVTGNFIHAFIWGLPAPSLPSKLPDWPLLLSLVCLYVERSLEGSGLKIARFGGEGMRSDSLCVGVQQERPQITGDVYIQSAWSTTTPLSSRSPSWERTKKPGTPPSTQHVSLSPGFLDPVTSIYCLLFLECSFQLLQMLVEIKDLREEKRMGMYLLNPLKFVHC